MANKFTPGQQKPVRWAWPWLTERDYEQGDYLCRCGDCGFTFKGPQRQATCNLCAAPHGVKGLDHG